VSIQVSEIQSIISYLSKTYTINMSARDETEFCQPIRFPNNMKADNERPNSI